MDSRSEASQQSHEELIRRIEALESFIEEIVTSKKFPSEQLKTWVQERKQRKQIENYARMADRVEQENHLRQKLRKVRGRESTPRLTQKCAYYECKRQHHAKLKELKTLPVDDPEVPWDMWWCSEACFKRWDAFEDLLQDAFLYERGEISEDEWKRKCQKAKSAHLTLVSET